MSLPVVERTHCVGNYGYATAAAQQALDCEANAVLRCHAEDDELEVWIEAWRTRGVQSCQERIRIGIVEHVERVFLKSELLIGGDVSRENKSLLVGDY